MAEVIYLVFVIFSNPTSLDAVHINDWRAYSERLGLPEKLTCQQAIKQPEFQAKMAKTLERGQTGTLQCK